MKPMARSIEILSKHEGSKYNPTMKITFVHEYIDDLTMGCSTKLGFGVVEISHGIDLREPARAVRCLGLDEAKQGCGADGVVTTVQSRG